jgi:HEAT repeat protein
MDLLLQEIQLIKALTNQDLISAKVKDLAYFDDKRAVPFLISLFQDDTYSRQVHNAAAICLRDLRAHEAVPAIMDYVNDPKTLGYHGTFLWALWELDCIEYFERFVEIIGDGNFECRNMAFCLVEGYTTQVDDNVRRRSIESLIAARLLWELDDNSEGDYDNWHNRIDFIDGALELFGYY